jgi:hypothetical protein
MRTRSAFVIAGLLAVATSQAAFNLSHNGSVVNVDETQARVNNWFVGGIDNVFDHSYWFRVGDAGNAARVSTISSGTVTMFGSRAAEVVYQNATMRVTLSYLLTASANGQMADLTESALFENLSGGTMSMRLFQYSDWDMNATAANDTATRLNSSSFGVVDGAVSAINAVQGGTPIPEFSEVALFPSTLNNIDLTNGYNLNTAAGGGIGQQITGDIAYAFQWNRDLAANGSFVMSTNKVAVVPEPGTIIALSLGAAALVARRRRKTAA